MRRNFPRAAETGPDAGGTAFDLAAVGEPVHDDDQTGEKIRATTRASAKRSNGAVLGVQNCRRRPLGPVSGAT
jgi:hypothetical protein